MSPARAKTSEFYNPEFCRTLLTILERRVKIGNECLVTVRIVAKELSEKFPEDKKHLSKMISLTLEKIGAPQWGLATTKYRNKKWRVRPYAARIYQIGKGTVDKLRSYIEQFNKVLGGGA